MKIELTRKQLLDLEFELIVAETTEKFRLENLIADQACDELIEYQYKCIERTKDLLHIVIKALQSPIE